MYTGPVYPSQKRACSENCIGAAEWTRQVSGVNSARIESAIGPAPQHKIAKKIKQKIREKTCAKHCPCNSQNGPLPTLRLEGESATPTRSAVAVLAEGTALAGCSYVHYANTSRTAHKSLRPQCSRYITFKDCLALCPKRSVSSANWKRGQKKKRREEKPNATPLTRFLIFVLLLSAPHHLDTR